MPARKDAWSVVTSAGATAPQRTASTSAPISLRVVPAGRIRDVGQSSGGDHRSPGLDLPDDGQLLPEVALGDRRQRGKGARRHRRRCQLVDRRGGSADVGHHPLPPADPDQLPDFRQRERRHASDVSGGAGEPRQPLAPASSSVSRLRHRRLGVPSTSTRPASKGRYSGSRQALGTSQEHAAGRSAVGIDSKTQSRAGPTGDHQCPPLGGSS
jgi:hypothetical protein